MSRTMLRTALLICLIPAVIAAQNAAPERPQAVAPEKPAQSSARPAASEPPAGQPVNVKLDLTITDQQGPGDPARKTVTLIIADRAGGAIRSTANVGRGTINVDATPQIMANGNIRLQLGLEYNPRSATVPGVERVKSSTGEMVEVPRDPSGSGLQQRVAIVLAPGKPLVLSQSADPLSDRRITVEVKADVLK
jgi:hypothetical protein